MRPLHTGLAAALALVTGLAALPAVSQKAKPVQKASTPKAGKYGALAVDRSQGYVFAWAYDHPSRQAANDYATAECAKLNGNCTVVVEFAGEGCAAYNTISESDGSAYGWGTAPTREAAQARSLQECNAFAEGKASCNNFVWACNSADVAPFKVLREDPVKPKPGKGDCLVQYDMDEETNGSDDWVNRYRSPVYRLSAKDCPSTSTERYHSYFWDTRKPGGNGGEYPAKDKDSKRHERGVAMARDFSAWISDKPTPGGDTHYRGYADVYVTAVKDDTLKDMVDGVAQSDSDRQHGVCLDFKPKGVVPVATLGAERCRSWVR